MVNRLVVSIHDVSPRHLREVEQWRALLAQWGVARRSYKVIPHLRGDAPTAASPDLVALLRAEAAAGQELLLHGYGHAADAAPRGWPARLRDVLTTRGCAEFAALDAAEARARVARGLAELEPALGVRLRGFTPPGWWQGPAVAGALRDAGLRFSTLTFGVLDLVRGRHLRAPVVVGLPGPGGAAARLLHAYNFALLPRLRRTTPWLRVSLHPYDLQNAAFRRAVERLLKDELAHRTPAAYEEMIA